jgi:hypothetical protein
MRPGLVEPALLDQRIVALLDLEAAFHGLLERRGAAARVQPLPRRASY